MSFVFFFVPGQEAPSRRCCNTRTGSYTERCDDEMYLVVNVIILINIIVLIVPIINVSIVVVVVVFSVRSQAHLSVRGCFSLIFEQTFY